MATMQVIPYSECIAVFTIRRADGHSLVLSSERNRLIHLNQNGDVAQDYGCVDSAPDYLMIAASFIDEGNGYEIHSRN